jgi:glycosyltransferase involved in cell wall biosynthesis
VTVVTEVTRDGGTVGGVSVIVMAYNESSTVEAMVREVVAVLDGEPGDHEVVIIDDGSTDGTAGIVDSLAASIPTVRVIHHPINTGLGGVYRTGWAEAAKDFVTFFPADAQFPASIIPRFLAAIASADFALGYLPERRDGPLGRAVSMAERALYGALFGGFPRFQGVFMCRTSVLREIQLRSPGGRGWAVVMELILRGQRGGYRMVSVPTVMRPRAVGRSKVTNVRTIVANVRQMIALRRLL